MAYGAYALAAIAAASALYSGYQQKQASDETAKVQEAAAEESKRIAGENAVRIESEGQEQQRRLTERMLKEEATARAQAAASGAVYNEDEDKPDSISLVLKSQKDENKRQLEWEKMAIASQAAIERRRGEYAYQAGKQAAKYSKKAGKAALLGGMFGAGKAAGQGVYDYNTATVNKDTGKGNVETWWSGQKSSEKTPYIPAR